MLNLPATIPWRFPLAALLITFAMFVAPSIGAQNPAATAAATEEVEEGSSEPAQAGAAQAGPAQPEESQADEAQVEAAPSHRGFRSVLPPLAAIVLALLLKDVLIALVVAIFLGALFVHGGVFTAFARTIDAYIVPALADADHAAILIFSALLSATVGVVARAGGTQAIVNRLTKIATSPEKGQLATWFMGVAIFFDDYANTLIVGPTMRPVTDRLRISREKLAYIVDSTAAPVVSLIPISTWIGFEIGLVQEAFDGLELARQAFPAIVASIPYRFYQFFALALGFSIAFSGRDFGPMRKAEQRAKGGAVLAEDHVVLADYDQTALQVVEGKPQRAINAVLPIATIIGMVLVGLWVTGSGDSSVVGTSGLERVRNVFAAANSYHALLWASFLGLLVAGALAISQRILTLHETSAAAIAGIKAPMVAFVVLILAWSLGAICGDLGTAPYLLQLTEGQLSPTWLPLVTFVLAAAVAFATGTSWGTMAILTPVVIPMAHGLNIAAGTAVDSSAYSSILLGTIASVLAGSVWGDHCSPIADTTVLASMASGSDHMAHVKTQLPYALSAGLAAVVVGIIPASFGLSPWLVLLLGVGAMAGLVRLLGRRTT